MECELNSSNDFLDFLFVTLHLQHTPDLHQINLFLVTHTHDLIERSQELERIPQNLSLFCALAHVSDDASKEVESFDVLEDVGGFVGNEDDVEIFKRLIDIANFICFDRGVLSVGRYKLR